ncbi:Major histocompatibility complex class I-related gene protein [Merluccius polli]|uniref:Major histocompatibility complex class I-related gene protein n=1 Tax=Merluccius polli TaxID=89951 RepID=A0AA47N1G2_MERPO|nr:Major histocompatibility complex class I-related gene protein [Merluccius polli]
MYGCEWDDEDDTTDGYEQEGYDGEDYIALDLKTWTYTALRPEADSDEQSWNQDRAYLEYTKNFYTKDCVGGLKKLLAYGKSALQRTGRSVLRCLSSRGDPPPQWCAMLQASTLTGVVVFWRRDGEELYEHVDHGEVLPNPDGTFQVSVDLDLAAVPREDWRRYECVVQVKGIEDILTPTGPGPRQDQLGTGWRSSSTSMEMKALIGLLLLVGCHGVSSVIHSLKFFQTALSGVSNFPEFVSVAMVDEVQIYYYDSNSQKVEVKQSWMDQAPREDLEEETRILQETQQVYNVTIETLKENFNQTGGVHTYQRMQGCEWDDEDDTTDGYEQFGYDGEDYIALDLKTWTWTALRPEADSDEQSWNQDRAELEYNKNYYTKECVDWLKKLLAYGKSALQRTERPEVSLLQRRPSSPVVCHATGFYPDRVVVFWRRDGEELYEHVDHGEVLPNPDGTFQVSVDLDLASVPREDWRRYECVVQVKGIEDIVTRLDPALVRTNWGRGGAAALVSGSGFPETILKRLIKIIITVLTAAAAAAAAVGVCVYKKRNGSHSSSGISEEQSPAPEAEPLNTLSGSVRVRLCWSSRSSSTSMEMKALIGLLLLVGCHGVSSVIHSLKFFQTALSGVSNFPEFVAVAMVDEVQIYYYDSNSQKVEVKQSWMDQAPREVLEEDTRILQETQQVYKVNIEILKENFNQTGGVHTYQRMQGCEWDDEDDTTDGYEQFGYDGEDYIALDLKTWTWTALRPEADSDEQIWNQDRAWLEYNKNYLSKKCVDWLKKLLAYGKSALQRTGRVT